MTLATSKSGIDTVVEQGNAGEKQCPIGILTLTSPIDINVHWFLKQNILLFPCYKFE